MTESVVVIENTTPVVQVTYPSQGVVEIARSEFGVEITNVCDVVVVGDTPTSVEVGDSETVETTVVNVVVEVADTGVNVVSVGEQGPTSEDFVKYQDVQDTVITDPDTVDEVTTIYCGEALPGSNHNQAVWRIRRQVSQTGQDDLDIRTTWAGGSAAFDKVWETTPGDELYKSYDYEPNS